MDAHSLGERKQNKLTANYLLVNEAISLSVKKKRKKEDDARPFTGEKDAQKPALLY